MLNSILKLSAWTTLYFPHYLFTQWMHQNFLDWVSTLLQSDQGFDQTFFLAVIIVEKNIWQHFQNSATYPPMQNYGVKTWNI